MKPVFFLFILFNILFFGCSKPLEEVAGGSGTEAGEAAGILKDPDGKPLANAQIEIYKKNAPMQEPVLIGETLSDSTGAFSFHGNVGNYALRARKGNTAVWLDELTIQKDSTTQLKPLQTSALYTVQGNLVAPQDVFPSSIHLEGTPYQCDFLLEYADGMQSFTCLEIPLGQYDIIAEGNWIATVVITDSSINLGSIPYNPQKIVLEDWHEYGWGTPEARNHNLSGIFGKSGWSVHTDGSSKIDPLQTNVLEHNILYDSLNGMGYLKTSYELDSNLSSPWVQINLSLGPDLYNFSSLDSLCLTHRGDSEVRLALGYHTAEDWDEVRLIVPKAGETWIRNCYSLNEWTKDSSQNNLTTQQIAESMNRIKFGPGKGTWWDLGPVEIIGLKLDKVF